MVTKTYCQKSVELTVEWYRSALKEKKIMKK